MQFDFSSIESTVLYIQSFGVYGPIVAFILFFVQAIAPIIPYMIFAGAAGMIYGNWIGFLLAWSGALIGACFLFLLSKQLGGNILIKKIQARYDFNLQEIDDKYIFWVLLMCRIFPVVPTPLINIGSGLAGVCFNVFALSSGLGKIPWAIAYVALGNYFINSHNFVNTLLIIAGILIFSAIGIHVFRHRMPGLTKKNM
ncbi:MAG: TVP38/TMEM64 family protein [Bacillota bacterium]|nr:TVP38/TMEM64 family protein [Bacillota bacterium]